MFISSIGIKNYRIFPDNKEFKVDNFNVPDNQNSGSGLTLFVGENGCGKTSLLDAITLPLVSYKADNFTVADLYDPNSKTTVKILAKQNFEYAATMPKTIYLGKGFLFEGGCRKRNAGDYLSSIIVSDQLFIRADGETKPEDGKPDLRIGVNNPWRGARFSENDILFLDKNRTYQTRSGTFNSTRFDRLMEDFSYQYLKQENNPIDCSESLIGVKQGLENDFLKQAIEKFNEVYGKKLSLDLIDSWHPFKHGCFGVKKTNKQQIPLGNLGSGFEMIFTLLYSFYLAKQSGKQLIILIDEPELHLHPKLQDQLVDILIDLSKTVQIILTTHSPLLVKQAMQCDKVRINVMRLEIDEPKIAEVSERVLSYLSANEINFIAFGLSTEEYHNELFEELKGKHGVGYTIKDFDFHYFQKQLGELPSYPYNDLANQVSIHTHLRTQIHHRKECGKPDIKQTEASIIKMRSLF